MVMAKPNSERLALANLGRQGFDAWYPQFMQEKLRPGRLSKFYARPLFPRYIFVRVAHMWRSLSGTYGVSRLVMAGAYPAVLSGAEVDRLKAREEDGFIVLAQPAKFEPGQKVRVGFGPFEGRLMIFAGMSGKERVRCLMECLGQQVPVELHEACIEAA